MPCIGVWVNADPYSAKTRDSYRGGSRGLGPDASVRRDPQKEPSQKTRRLFLVISGGPVRRTRSSLRTATACSRWLVHTPPPFPQRIIPLYIDIVAPVEAGHMAHTDYFVLRALASTERSRGLPRCLYATNRRQRAFPETKELTGLVHRRLYDLLPAM